MIHGETVHSPLPMDLPWWQPDHAIFFGVLYLVMAILGAGLAWVFYKAMTKTCEDGCADH